MKDQIALTQIELDSCRESIQEDLLVLMDGLPQEAQDRACQIVVDNFNKMLKK